MELRWLGGGCYIMVDGFLPGSPVGFHRDADGTSSIADGTPSINVAEADTVRRTVGLT